MLYKDYLKSDDWKNKRTEKIKKFKYKWWPRCSICSTDKTLEVHHLIYEKDLTENKQESLRILCRLCHQTTHDLINEWILVYPNRNHNSRFAMTKSAVKKRLWYWLKNMF